MGLLADAQALMMGASARMTVHYGRDRVFAGGDLPDPRRLIVPTRHGRIRCDVYADPTRTEPAPVHVHLHGGAFLMRYPKMDDFWCRYLVAEAGVTVVNVDYDIAPRRRYPVAQEQAYDVLAWVQKQADDWDPTRTTLSGFSAGGNLAAAACLQAVDLGTPLPRLQLLGVPSLDVSTTDKPAPAGAMISPAVIDLVRRTYFRDESRRTEPYASPLLAPDLTGQPPTLVVTAGRDRLRAEAVAYVARLAEAGVPVDHLDLPDRDHYFLDGPRERAHDVMRSMATAVRDA
ncbi:alpha/beta hydrolase [Aeromicrobium sp. Leaf350]|uniref:alpha/beta hydrolase n=1 Tax=Aeromicrobium sp. Leaf350 TaxID=2876565 RepID=UPI001E5B8B3F|nr:alpha/beta hydrolase [Aeromicrobium sp. Leaf350]